MVQVLQLLSKVTVLLVIACEVVINGNQVCHDRYGCFSDSSPWTSQFIDLKLPMCPERIRTSFKIYADKRGFRNGKSLDPLSPLDLPKRRGKVIVLIHGKSVTGHLDRMYLAMRPTLLQKRNANGRGNLNVITVDWSYGVVNADQDKGQIFGNGRLVAAQIVYLLKKWIGWRKLTCNKVHIIGFGIHGTSIAGIAGENMKSGENQCTIARITGLDPAQAEEAILFNVMDNATKLDQSDAEFVDVIHSHTRFASGSFSYMRVGKVDFYLNSGYEQPGCVSPPWPRDYLNDCHHFTAVQVFNDTILPSQGHCCRATECLSYQQLLNDECQSNTKRQMGFDHGAGQPGKFYLETNDDKPYCDDPCDGGKNH